jgi:hypothetical protein
LCHEVSGRLLYLLFFLFTFATVPLFAYLDPGTGSLLLYALVGIATTALFALRNLWYWAKGKAFLPSAVAVSAELPEVVFHSEGGKYWQVFQPVLAALAQRGVSCAYVTPDPADPGLGWEAKGFTAVRPGGEMMTIAYMNAVKAAMVVSTTPSLDVYMLRRSPKVKHYAHLFHAPTDVAFYEKFAFDYYDSLLTVGSFQERSIRELERRRRLKGKELYQTGCPYYDYMREEMKSLAPRSASELTVLYAPAWGQRSSVLKYGTGILDALARAGIRTIFRPHPQFYVSHVGIIREIEKGLAASSLVEIDRNRTGIASMSRSDVMITDLSGVLFDYAFLFERPIILANSQADVGGQEGEDLPGEIWDVAMSRRLARCLADDEVEHIPRIVREASADGARHAGTMRAIRDGELYNFGHAGPAAADNIARVLGGLV